MNFARIYKLLLPARNLQRAVNYKGQSQDLGILYKNMSFCSWVKDEVYRDHFEPGIYVCYKCKHPLFSSVKKYKHDTPWPAFTNTVQSDSVNKRRERIYVCVECEHKLFSSKCKYEHETPWPAFTETVTSNSVSKVPEEGRTGTLKVSCGRCGNGLGHEFLKDGPDGTSSRF